jgi:hypothetical protein
LTSAVIVYERFRMLGAVPSGIPPRRHASFHLLKDDGGGVNSSSTQQSRHRRRKIIAAGPTPPDSNPMAGEERDSGERTMGWSEDDFNENG